MSVTAVPGFLAGGIACGIKPGDAPDLALVATADRRPAAAAAVFTANRATAAPVQVSRAHLSATGGHAVGVVLNSGNANAATGAAGKADAARMCELTAAALGCAAEQVLVCSTGLIGYRLPMHPIEQGIPRLAGALTGGGGGDAARAIMTTDTRPKEVVVAGSGFTVGGMAKGAAMLAPNMATMLAVLTTDAALGPHQLHDALRAAVAETFNCLTTDGATSTNDTVILLATGRGAEPAPGAFSEALEEACGSLAAQMADDAEGATKVVTVDVTGAATDGEAQHAARCIAESQLVKCSWYGQDPYWGRIVSEVGASGVAFDADRVSVAYGDHVICADGVAADHDESALRQYMAGRHLKLVVDLHIGAGTGAVLATDLTHAYIDENKGTS